MNQPAEYDDLPPPPRPGYAPRLCGCGPLHYARRDPTAAGFVWKCVECGLRWTTKGEV